MARPGCGTELTTRSDQAELAALVVVGDVALPGTPVPLLNAEAEVDTWRIVEVFSRTALPFEVGLAWSSGSGSGADAQITVARSTRICVLARTLRITATNLAPALNRVGVTVADGFAPTRNVWEVRGHAVESVPPFTAPVPPFAESLRLELGEPAAWPDVRIDLRDAVGTRRATFNAALQPQLGIPVGAATRAEVVTNINPPGVPARIVFTLSL